MRSFWMWLVVAVVLIGSTSVCSSNIAESSMVLMDGIEGYVASTFGEVIVVDIPLVGKVHWLPSRGNLFILTTRGHICV